MSSNNLPLTVEQATSLVKSRRSLRGIIKLDSLVVNGLDRCWDRGNVEQELRSIFKESEGVKDIKIITNNASQELLGHAYVNYVSQEAARKALARHKYNAKIRGRQLKMMYSVRPNDLIHEDEIKMHFSVCVKNLDPSIDLKNLDMKFSEYGDILRSHVDDDTHGRDRFALIQFMDMTSAEEAVRMNQKAKFGNTIITVEPYRPKVLMETTYSEPIEQPRTPPLPRTHSLLQHMCDSQLPANDEEEEEEEVQEQVQEEEQEEEEQEVQDVGRIGNGRCSPTIEKEIPNESQSSNPSTINRWSNGRPAQFYSEILLSNNKSSNNQSNQQQVLEDSRVNVSSPVLFTDQETNGGLDSDRSQIINQQSKVASLFFMEGSQQSRNSSNSPTAVNSPPPPASPPREEVEFNQYKLFEGTQIFNNQSLFGGVNGSEQMELFQLLPQSVSSELDYMQNLKCPLSREVYQDPVIAADGIVYERNQIQSWLTKSSVSPCTQQNLESAKLMAIPPLRDALSYIRQQQSIISQQQMIISDLKKRMEQIKGLCQYSQFQF